MSEVHAMLSPSGSHGWMTCTGKPAMEHGTPNESSKYADEGTAAHQVAAWCLTEERDAAAYIGRRVDLKTRTVEVTDEMAEAVQIYVDKIREYANGNLLMVEQRVPLDHITSEEGAEGTSDVVIIADRGDELQVHDLKFGMGVKVYASETEVIERASLHTDGDKIIGHVEHGNSQLLMYASGAFAKFAPLGDFKRIRIVIHQPRLGHLSEWDCSVAELQAFEEKARSAAKTAMIAFNNRSNWMGKSTAYLVPGDAQCRWCRAKATCPALAAQVVSTVTADVLDFDDLTAVPLAKRIEVESVDPKAGHVTNAILATFMPALDLIEQWCSAVRGKIESELLAGRDVPGYKIVAGKKGNRAWSDADAVEEALKKMRLKKEEMYDFKLISPTTAEKLLKATPKRWATIEALIKQADGKPHVTEVTDKRPALVLTPPADDFAAIEDESVV